MAVLAARDVHKRFGARSVLAGIDLALPPGRFVLVSGRSGSGKSTLFAILAGIEAPTTGTVQLDARSYGTMQDEERTRFRLEHLGLVFQDFRLIPDLTVSENVQLPMHLARRRRDKERRALRILDHLGLQRQAHEFPETLSGGEQQRVAIARALANDPSVVLADEPTANLDEENAHNVLRLLRSLAQQDRAVLVVSHDPIARRYADEHLRLAEGRLVAVASPALATTKAAVVQRETRARPQQRQPDAEA